MADDPRAARDDLQPHPGAPRWVKVLVIILFGLLLLFVVLQLTGVLQGRHGPGRHFRVGVSAVTGENVETVRAAWISMEVIGWYVLVPLAFGTLITGLVMSLGTQWGIFRHYWVLITLVLTLGSTVILLVHMPAVSGLVVVARSVDDSELVRLGGDLAHPVLGLVVLLAITALNVYKPRGVTRYGWRKQEEERRAGRRGAHDRQEADGRSG